MNTPDFAATLRAIRQKRGLTQTQLAERAGVPQSTISSLETRALSESLTTLLAICRALDVTPNVLLGIEHDATPSLEPNKWLVDVDELERRLAGGEALPDQTWATAIPERWEVVSSVRYEQLRNDIDRARKGRRKKP